MKKTKLLNAIKCVLIFTHLLISIEMQAKISTKALFRYSKSDSLWLNDGTRELGGSINFYFVLILKESLKEWKLMVSSKELELRNMKDMTIIVDLKGGGW